MKFISGLVAVMLMSVSVGAIANINKDLHKAVKNSNIDAVKTAIENGADVNSVSGNGKQPLFKAAGRDNFKVVELLLKHGAQLNGRNTSGKTALMNAARKGHYANVQILVSYGADMNLRDDSGYTAYQHASDKDHYEVSRYLKRQMKSKVSVAVLTDLEGKEISEAAFLAAAEYAFKRKRWTIESKSGNIVTGSLVKQDRIFRAKMVLTPKQLVVRYVDGLGVLKVSYLHNLSVEVMSRLGY